MRLDEIQWYHGSSAARKELRIGTGGEDVYGNGIYLTTNPKRAMSYFGHGAEEGYLHYASISPDNEYVISEPFTEEDANKVAELAPKIAKMNGNNLQFGRNNIPIGTLKGTVFALFKNAFKSGKIAGELVKAMGYDAIRAVDPQGGEQISLFNPQDVKVTDIKHVQL